MWLSNILTRSDSLKKKKGLERPLFVTGKVKFKLQWRPQDAEEARFVRALQKSWGHFLSRLKGEPMQGAGR